MQQFRGRTLTITVISPFNYLLTQSDTLYALIARLQLIRESEFNRNPLPG